MPSKSKKPAAKATTSKAASKPVAKAAAKAAVATKPSAKVLKKKDAAALPQKEKNENMIPALELAGTQMSETTAAAVSKNFRSHPDMENFYRFIHEHDLRVEALQIVDELITARLTKKGKASSAVLN